MSSLSFFWSVEQNARDKQMTTCMTEGARQERHEKRETNRKAREMVFHGLVIFWHEN